MNDKLLKKFGISDEDAHTLHTFKLEYDNYDTIIESDNTLQYTQMNTKDLEKCRYKPCVLEEQDMTIVYVPVDLSVKTDTMLKCIRLLDLYSANNSIAKYRFTQVFLVEHICTAAPEITDTDEPRKRGRPPKTVDPDTDEPRKRGRPASIIVDQEFIEYLYDSDGNHYCRHGKIVEITQDKQYKVRIVENDTTSDTVFSHKQIQASIERSTFDKNYGYIDNIVGMLVGQSSMYKNDEYLVKLSQLKQITCVFPCSFESDKFSFNKLKIGDNLVLNRNNIQHSIDELKLEVVCTNQGSQDIVFAYHYHVPNDTMWVYECYFTCVSETELEELQAFTPISNLVDLYETKMKKNENNCSVQLQFLAEYESKLLDYTNIRVLAKQW